MSLPIVSWRNADNSEQVYNWEIGTVDAGNISKDFIVLIWNNHPSGQDEYGDVADMQNVSITTKDANTGNTGDLVVDKWIEVKNVSLNDSEFTPIGGEGVYPIRTTGTTTFEGDDSTPGVPPHAIDPEYGSVDILGVKNDGTINNSAGNFIQVVLRANVPTTAGAGLVNFLTRVTYSYSG